MKQFQFKLQKLLDYRETKEDVLLAELGAAQADLDRELSRLSEIISTKHLFQNKLKDELMIGNTGEIQDIHQYLNQLAFEEMAQRERVQNAENHKETKKFQVIDASKDRKVLENLKTRKQTAHNRELQDNEQKFLDDLASFRRATS